MDWGVVYYQDEFGFSPGVTFLGGCPRGVRMHMLAVLESVRAAPPPKFSGGGKWQAMRKEMRGFYEIRVTGPPKRTHYRLFCVLDNGPRDHLAACGFEAPQIAVVAGLTKANATLFQDRIYKKEVRVHAEAYLASKPRSIVS